MAESPGTCAVYAGTNVIDLVDVSETVESPLMTTGSFATEILALHPNDLSAEATK